MVHCHTFTSFVPNEKDEMELSFIFFSGGNYRGHPREATAYPVYDHRGGERGGGGGGGYDRFGRDMGGYGGGGGRHGGPGGGGRHQDHFMGGRGGGR